MKFVFVLCVAIVAVLCMTKGVSCDDVERVELKDLVARKLPKSANPFRLILSILNTLTSGKRNPLKPVLSPVKSIFRRLSRLLFGNNGDHTGTGPVGGGVIGGDGTSHSSEESSMESNGVLGPLLCLVEKLLKFLGLGSLLPTLLGDSAYCANLL